MVLLFSVVASLGERSAGSLRSELALQDRRSFEGATLLFSPAHSDEETKVLKSEIQIGFIFVCDVCRSELLRDITI